MLPLCLEYKAQNNIVIINVSNGLWSTMLCKTESLGLKGSTEDEMQ